MRTSYYSVSVHFCPTNSIYCPNVRNARNIYFFSLSYNEDTCRHHEDCVIFLMVCHPALDTIEKEMRTLFNIPSEKETRLWNKYMSNTYEQLNKPDSTVQDAGLFQGQVGHCPRRNTPFYTS